jgi:C4-dicarboxylate transporter, DctM subunit
MTILLPIILLIALILLGLPVSISLGLSGLIGVWMMTGSLGNSLSIVGLVPLDKVSESTLLALPLFIFLAHIVSVTRMSDDFYDAASAWLSGIRGGLPASTVFAGAAVGAISGSTLAAATALSKIAVRNQVRTGHSAVLASGSAAMAAVLSILIPPSIMMIVYGVQTETSIGDLLIAGLLPGLLLAVLLVAGIFIWVAVRPSAAPKAVGVPWGHRLRATTKIWPLLLVMLLIFVLLYGGFATATEVAGIGALAGIIVALAMRRLTWSKFVLAAKQSVYSTAMIMLIVVGGTIFARFITLTRAPQKLGDLIAASGLSPVLVVVLIILAYFILSMFMDELPLMILMLPITFPVVVELGFDPVWFGVMTMLMVIMGLVFPPVGIVAFVVSGAAGVRSATVFKGASILLVPVFATTALVFVFPAIALWLPSMR